MQAAVDDALVESVEGDAGGVNKSILQIDYNELRYSESPAPPDYPRMAQRRRLQGTVLLMLIINTRGAVDRVSIDHSSGYSMLDKAATKAALGWRFMPAKKAGRRIVARALIPVRFSLQGNH